MPRAEMPKKKGQEERGLNLYSERSSSFETHHYSLLNNISYYLHSFQKKDPVILEGHPNYLNDSVNNTAVMIFLLTSK